MASTDMRPAAFRRRCIGLHPETMTLVCWLFWRKSRPRCPCVSMGDERQEKIATEIQQCHGSGKSWVAVDDKGKIVGFALARPDAHEGKAAVYVPYLGVSASSRKHGIFAALMQKLKTGGVVVKANVLHDNKSAMVDRLSKISFTRIGSDVKQTKLAWLPPIKNQSV